MGRNCVISALLVADVIHREVEAKYCYYTDTQSTKYYYCGSYEYCCSGGCCENFISFYRLWYFWFCIAVVVMFCSGGGYWYKRRYIQQRLVVNQSPQPTTIISVTPGASQCPPTYVTPTDTYTNNPGTGYSMGCPPGPFPAYTTVACCPKPPVIFTTHGALYNGGLATVDTTNGSYGPPPSYDSVYPIQGQMSQQRS